MFQGYGPGFIPKRGSWSHQEARRARLDALVVPGLEAVEPPRTFSEVGLIPNALGRSHCVEGRRLRTVGLGLANQGCWSGGSRETWGAVVGKSEAPARVTSRALWFKIEVWALGGQPWDDALRGVVLSVRDESRGCPRDGFNSRKARHLDLEPSEPRQRPYQGSFPGSGVVLL